MALKIVEFPDGSKFSNRSAADVTDPDETGLADGGHDPGLLVVIEKTIEQAQAAIGSGDAAAGDAAAAAASAAAAAAAEGVATAQAGIATTKAGEAAQSALDAAAAVGGLKVSLDDSTPGSLEEKLLPGPGLSASTQNPGANETRTFRIAADFANQARVWAAVYGS